MSLLLHSKFSCRFRTGYFSLCHFDRFIVNLKMEKALNLVGRVLSFFVFFATNFVVSDHRDLLFKFH